MKPNKPGICNHPVCMYPVHRDRDGNPFRYCREHGMKVSRGEMGACSSCEDSDGIFVCELAKGHPLPHRDGGLRWYQ